MNADIANFTHLTHFTFDLIESLNLMFVGYCNARIIIKIFSIIRPRILGQRKSLDDCVRYMS